MHPKPCSLATLRIPVYLHLLPHSFYYRDFPGLENLGRKENNHLQILKDRADHEK
jgi:hypothetical protein